MCVCVSLCLWVCSLSYTHDMCASDCLCVCGAIYYHFVAVVVSLYKNFKVCF